MILNAYTVHDTKALTFNQPFFAINHGIARRMIADVAKDNTTSLGRHPNDFVVYCVGTYDDQTGRLTAHEIREHVVDVISLVYADLAKTNPVRDLFNTTAEGAK